MDPNIIPFRLFLLVGSLVGFLLYASYSASFAAFLSVPNTLIHKFEDLYTHGYTLYTHPVFNHFADHFVKVSQLTKAQVRKTKKLSSYFLQTQDEKRQIVETSSKTFTDMEHWLQQISNSQSRIAIILNIHGLYIYGMQANITEDVLCETSILTKTHGRVKEAMILRRGSPLREFFNHR